MNRTKSRRLSRGFSGSKSRRRFEASIDHGLEREWRSLPVEARRKVDRFLASGEATYRGGRYSAAVDHPFAAALGAMLAIPVAEKRSRETFANNASVAIIVGGEAIPLGTTDGVRIEDRGVDERGIHQHVVRFGDE